MNEEIDVKNQIGAFVEKLVNEFSDRGINVKTYGAACNANYRNPANLMWYEDAAYTIPAQDDTDAIQAAINAAPKGGVVRLPARSIISRQLVINKPIKFAGNYGRNKSTNEVFGSVLVIPVTVDQNALESAILINASNVKIDGIALKGKGSSYGSVGILCRSSNGAKLDVYVEGFNGGVKFGAGSSHVTLTHAILTGNNHGAIAGHGNHFDFNFNDCMMDGNVVSAFFIEADTATENITFIRGHIGSTQYGVLQDPTTKTGDGLSGLTMIDTPIEQVTIQQISLVNGGNIRIEGGYWTWSAAGSTATEGFLIKNVNIGPIWFAAKLEPTYTNSNSQWLLRVSGYTNYKVHFEGSLNGFAPYWTNFNSTTIPPRMVVINNENYGGQTTGVTKKYLTYGAINNITNVGVYGAANFAVWAYLRVERRCTVGLWVSYHNGSSPVDVYFQQSAVLEPGEYYFQPKYFYAHPAGVIVLKATVDAASAAWVSASIEAKPC